MKTLIVATDFSKEAENAAEYACAAAKYMNTKVVLFNSFSIPLHVSNARLPAAVFKELLDNNSLMLKKKATKRSEKYSIEVEFETGFVQLREELSALFVKYNAKMVIMGTTQHSLGQELFGSTNTSSILKLQIPVLAVPLGVKYQPIKRILFACDFLRGINARILEEINDFAVSTGSDVEIFNVQNKLIHLEDEATYSQSITEGLEGISHSYKHIESETVIEEIKNEIKRI